MSDVYFGVEPAWRSEASYVARDGLSVLRWSVEARDAAAKTDFPPFHQQCGYGK